MQDVIIIGAPRSGTNMLRDVLTALPGYTTWPCDEINLVWRHGNKTVPHDELVRARARPPVVDYIRSRFDGLRDHSRGAAVVEKTCANSLRVDFVHAVKPEARYVFITRDGLDAAASAMKRWHAPLDLGYTLPKVRQSPYRDLPYYGARFVTKRWKQWRGAEQGQGWWGPKPSDWQALSEARPLDEICLIQWKRCIEMTEKSLRQIAPSQVHQVNYEGFVRDPRTGLRDLLAFLGTPEQYDDAVLADVTSASVGKGRASFTASEVARLSAVGGDTLERLAHEL